MKKTKVGFIKTVHYFCLVGIAVLGLITIIATGGGDGGPDNPKEVDYVTVTGFVDDGIPNSPISNAYCVFVDLNGVQQPFAFDWANDGRFGINVLPDKEGYIQCAPREMRKLRLCTFLSTKDRVAGDKISGENVTLTTTLVADIINSENAAVPQARKLELLHAIENEDPELNLLVFVSSIMWKEMLNAQINVNLGGYPGGDGDADSGGAGGDTGDGADFSPIPNARCDFALDLKGDVLYSSALDDLRDGELNRPDLAAIRELIRELMERELIDREDIKEAFDEWFPEGVGIPYSDIADENGRYFLPIPPNVQGYVRCSPPDQPELKLATLVPKLQEGEKKDDQDVTPATTIFSHSIASKLDGDLDTVKENYLDDIAGLEDIQIIKDGETITDFVLKGDPKDKDVGLVAFSAASLFNILYKNEMDVDYLAALDGLIDNQEVRSEDLEDLGIPEEDAEKWSGVVNKSNVDAGKDLDPTNPVILGDALSKARIKVKVLDWLDEKLIPIEGAEVDITDAPGFIVCKDCPGETDENGEVTLTLTGVKTEPAEITVKTSGVSGFKDKYAKTKVVAFATVGLEIVMTSEFLLQVTKSGTGDGTVTSSPAGINCGTDCSEKYSEDTVVSLTAQADTDSDFTGWSGGGCSGTGDCTVTTNQDHTVIATFTLKPDKIIPKVTITATDSAASEPGTNTGKYRIQRTGTTVSSLTVYFSMSGTASNGTDYVTIPSSKIIPAGLSYVDVTLTPRDDSVYEGSETAILTISTHSSYNRGSPYQATVTISDNELPPKSTVTVTATDSAASEPGTNTGRYRIQRTGTTVSSLTVYFSMSGTASNGTDYVTIPSSKIIPAGLSYVDVTLTPRDDSVYEGSETAILTISTHSSYNRGSPYQATVTISDNELPKPDLVITTGSPTVTPSTVAPGGSVKLSGWTVKNQGNTASGFFNNGFYLSTNSTISTGDTYLDGNSNYSLAAGAQFAWGGPTLTIPAGTAAGTYYVGILVDRTNAVSESNESNNYVSRQITVAPKPDLVITTGSPTVTPSTVAPGGSVKLSGWTVKNQGNTASGFFNNGFYLSTNSTISTGDTYLDGNSNYSLAAGAQFAWGGPTLTIPAGTAAGTYYVGILVDRTNAVSESNESNNYVSRQITVAPKPDLVITTGSPTVTPSTVAPGGSVKLSGWTVKNQGNTASGFFNNGFYLSTNSTISTGDTYLDGNSNYSLAAGAQFAWGGPTLTIPAGTAAGTYYVGILVDRTNAVSESNESNNYVSRQITVYRIY